MVANSRCEVRSCRVCVRLKVDRRSCNRRTNRADWQIWAFCLPRATLLSVKTPSVLLNISTTVSIANLSVKRVHTSGRSPFPNINLTLCCLSVCCGGVLTRYRTVSPTYTKHVAPQSLTSLQNRETLNFLPMHIVIPQRRQLIAVDRPVP